MAQEAPNRRSHWFPYISLWVLAVLAATRPAFAGDPRQPAADYLRHTFTTEDGLPSNVVDAVLQTQDGFLIVGSQAGLYRFDGHRFAEMNSDPPKDLIVHVLAQGPEGDLWVGTSFGLYRVPHAEIDQRTQNLSVYHLGSGPIASVLCLHFTRAGVLWAGTSAGLFYLAGDHFEQVTGSYFVARIEEARNGHLLITTTHGLLEWDGSRLIERPDILVTLGIGVFDLFHVLQDRSGAMWYCTKKGIFRQSGGSVRHFLPDPTGDKHGAFRAYEDPAGDIWFLTEAGLFQASSDSFERVAPEASAFSITADHAGNLWFGTNGAGLIRLKPRTVTNLTKADGLPNNVVMTVLAAADGKLWVGNNCGGLSWFDGRRFHTYDEKDGLTEACIFSLAEDSNHDLWVGTFNHGVFRFHAGHFQAFTQADGLGSNTVNGILAARDGSLWIATSGGLTRLRDGVLRNYTTADGLSHNVTGFLLQDRSGAIWVSTPAGIDRLDGDKFVPALRSQDRHITIAGESPLGDLYVADGWLGLRRLKGGKLMGTAHLHGRLMQVFQQDLWIAGGTGGVTRVGAASLRNWENAQQEPIDHTEFGKADSLLLGECSEGYPNMTVTKDGKLWVATLGGVAMLDLSRLPHAAGKPFEYISEVEVDRKKRNAGRELILPAGLHHVEIQLGSVELSSPERAHIQYRLDGIDSAWLDAKPDGTAVYTTIPHGSYLFHLRASNGEGFWDRQGIVYRITQEPFFYETAAFRILMIAAGCILLTSAYRFRLRQESARINVRLEERVAERTRIARDLHDTLLQSFQGVLLKFSTVKYVMRSRPDEAEETLERIIDEARAAITEGRDAVQGMRPCTVAANDLARAISTFGKGLAADQSGQPCPEFGVLVEGKSRDLPPLVRDEVYRIAAESLRNAFRHAQAKRIEVEIHYDQRRLRLLVRDDGKGIDPQVLDAGGRTGHHGMPGMLERATLAGGQLAVCSELGSGTEIEVTIPASIAYTKSAPTGQSASGR